MKDFQFVIQNFLKNHEKHKKYIALLTVLSLLVSFAVPFSLIMPAVSMTGELICGMEEHIHSDECYEISCGIEESDEHLHNADCYTLVCDIPEHIHSQECYSDYQEENNFDFENLSPDAINISNVMDTDEQGRTLVSNMNSGVDANDGYSKGQLSEVSLLIGDGVEWAANCKNASDVIEAAKRKYFLGIASDFCIFLESDFNPSNADAEGRVAVGGDVNFTGSWNYQIGNGDYTSGTALKNTDNYTGVTDFAHAIANGKIKNINTLSQGKEGNGSYMYPADEDLYKRFVIGSSTDINNCSHLTWPGAVDTLYQVTCSHNNVSPNEVAQFYQADLINFTDTFTWLRQQSEKLSKKTATGTTTFSNGVLTLDGPGVSSDAKTVYFTMNEWDDDIREIRFANVPDNANLIVNCGGNANIGVDGKDDIFSTYINDTCISRQDCDGQIANANNNKKSEQILYNFYNATSVFIDANFNGTILAPNADVTSGNDCNGHLSGSLIAKTFTGGLEFGYRPYRGGMEDILGSSMGYTIPVDKVVTGATNQWLPGAKFEIIDSGNNVVNSFTSGEGTNFVDIPSKVDFTGGTDYRTSAKNLTGTYTIKEVSAPEGYIADTENTCTVTITEEVQSEGLIETDSGTIPTHIKATVQFGSSTPFKIDLKDIYSYDGSSSKHIRRELKIDNETFYLEIDNGKVTAVSKKDNAAETQTGTYVSVLNPNSETNVVVHSTSYSNVLDENGLTQTATSVKTIYDEPIAKYNIGKIVYNGNSNPDINNVKFILYYSDGSNSEISPTFKSGADNWSDSSNYWHEFQIDNAIQNVVGFKIVRVGTNENNENVYNDIGEDDLLNNIVFQDENCDNIEGLKGNWGVTDSNQITAETTTRTEITSWVVTTDVEVTYLSTSYCTQFTSDTYYIYPTMQLSESIGNKQTVTTTITLEGGGTKEEKYYYNPDDIMMMPMPSENLKFENRCGLLFKKVDSNGNPLSGATIKLQYKSGNDYADVADTVWNWTGSSFTIDPLKLGENVVYKFVETAPPTGYETAPDIYFKKISDTEIHYASSEDDLENTTNRLDLTNDNNRTITMTDTKITGAKVKLKKTKDDGTTLLDGAKFKLYSADDETTPIYPTSGDGFTVTNGEIDLYETFKNNSSDTNSDYIQNGYLKPGLYYLKEVTPPTAYQLPTEPFYFTIKENSGTYEVETGLPQYVSFEIESTNEGKQIWARGNASNVTKVEIKVTSPADGQSLVLYEDSALKDKTAIIQNGVATFEFNPPLSSVGDFKIQNVKYDNGAVVTEVRVYGDSSSGGSSSGESSTTDFGEGITFTNTGNDRKIVLNSTGLSRAVTSDMTDDSVVMTITFNTSSEQKGWGNAKFVGTLTDGTEYTQKKDSYLPTGCYSSEYQGNYNISFNQEVATINLTVSDIRKILNVSDFSKISSFGISYWNSTTISDVSFTKITANTDPETPSGSEENNENESTGTISGTATDGVVELKVTNSKAGAKTTITVEKKWSGDNDFTSERPTSIQVQLYQATKADRSDGTKYGEPVTLNSDNNWTKEWNNIPRIVDGTESDLYYYYVQEITAPTGYEVSYGNNNGVSSGIITITNTLKTVDISVNKEWVIPEGVTGVTNPASVTVKLQTSSDGTSWTDVSGKTLTLNSSNSWTGTFEKLPAGKYYKVVETNIPTGWTASYSTDGKKFDNSENITVTNTLSLASLNIKKYWDDGNANSRPSQIQVELYRTKTSSSNNSGSGSSTPVTPTPTNDVKSDYSRLLQYSLYFYDANMCGNDVGESSDLNWRDDCHTYDAVPGGYHDAGDHVMFGLPQGYTASTLGWSYYENKAIYDGLGQTEHYRKIMKRFCDFFVDSTTIENGEVTKFLYQKGNGGTDHNYWVSPEKQTQEQRGELLYTNNSASDIAAEYAAALAQYAINFPNDSQKQDYLNCAKALYAFSTKYNSRTSEGPSGFYYDDTGRCTDEQAWAAAWLYLATNNNHYKNECEEKLDKIKSVPNRGYFWDDVALGAMIVYKKFIDNSYDWSVVTNYLSSKCDPNSSFVILDEWGSARHNTALQMLALSASKVDGVDYTDWCKKQMNYILGDNSISSNENSSTCFVVGFADNSAKYPHHRGASCVSGWDSYNASGGIYPNGHELIGALVAGPKADGSYKDHFTDTVGNEVALDYNATLVGAAAALFDVYHTGSLVTDASQIGTKREVETAYYSSNTSASSFAMPSLNNNVNDSENNVSMFSNPFSSSNIAMKKSVEACYTPYTGVGTVSSQKTFNISYENVTRIELDYTFDKSGGGANLTFNNWDIQNKTSKDEDTYEYILSSPTNIYNFCVQGMWNASSITITEIRFYYQSDNSFSVTPEKSSIVVGEKTKLTADGATDDINWNVSNGSVTKESDGFYYYTAGNTAGDVTITGTDTDGKEGTATVTVSAFAITGNKNIPLTEGNSIDFPSTNASGSVTWQSSDETIAKIENNQIKAVKNGTVTFTATYNGNTDTITVTVQGKDLTLSIDKNKIRVGGTATLTPNPSDSVTYSVNKNDIISITGNTITGSKAGTATITATRGGKTANAVIEVVDSLSVSGNSKMNIGATQTLTAENAIGTVTWSSSNEQVLTVENGVVTAVSNGKATITATDSSDNSTATFDITVTLTAVTPDIPKGAEFVKTITLISSENWEKTLSDLPITDGQGKTYHYYIAEIDSYGIIGEEGKSQNISGYVPISYSGNGSALNEASATELSVTNKKSDVDEGSMPSTGGTGTEPYKVIGMVMTGGALIMLGIRRRKKHC